MNTPPAPAHDDQHLFDALNAGAVSFLRFSALGDRELQLLELVASGLDNATIARKMHLAPKTIRNQISALLDKLEM